MSPHHTLASPPVLAPAPEIVEFDRLHARRLAPVPDVFETLVIKAVPPFESASQLRLVESPKPSRSPKFRSVPTVAGGQRPIRLTRRGRLVLLGLAVLLMLFGFSIGKSVSFASTVPSPPAGSPSLVVQPGDTLWSIATQAAPKADPRVTVQRIIDLNALPGAEVQAGQQLALPS